MFTPTMFTPTMFSRRREAGQTPEAGQRGKTAETNGTTVYVYVYIYIYIERERDR